MGTAKVNGAALRVIRERSDMSVADLVAALATFDIKVHADHIRNIELGYKQPSPNLLGGIARALKIPKIVLIADPEPEKVA